MQHLLFCSQHITLDMQGHERTVAPWRCVVCHAYIYHLIQQLFALMSAPRVDPVLTVDQDKYSDVTGSSTSVCDLVLVPIL